MLTLSDDARRLNTPPLQELASLVPQTRPRGQLGRGWGLSANTLAELHKRAAEMRRNPTEPEKRLWRHLSNSQLEGHKFRRQQVIGWFIADFACPSASLIVEVDGDTHDGAKDEVRDDALADHGYRVIRVTNLDVMHNLEGVLTLISEALRDSVRPHPNPSPEGEGLKEEAMPPMIFLKRLKQ